MSKQQLVLNLIDRNIKLHTVNGVQCIRYKVAKPILPTHLKQNLNPKTLVCYSTFTKGSNKQAIMWDNINRVKYLRLDWLFDMVQNKQLSI